MSDPIDPKVLDAFANSIADHSYVKHGHEFRNEKPDGSPRSSSPKKTYGEALPINSREDLAEHIKTTVQSPDTKYFIDESAGGRMVFHNEKTGTTVIFNPHQLGEGDGHVGSIMREKVAENGTAFDKELNLSEKRLGHAPEIRSAADGKWSLPADVFNTPTARSADFVADLPPKAPGSKLPDAILDANKLDVAAGVKEISKLAKAGRLGANITGVGVVIGAASLALMDQAHAAQRDFAGDLHESGVLDDEAYQSYLELNNDTENMLYGDLGISTVDPTGASIVITAAAETKARVDFKEWADEHAPGLSEEHFQTLSMSMFPDNSARAELLWEAKDQIPATTEGQPQELHQMIELNNLYDKASKLGYSHKEGYVYGGNLGEAVTAARTMGIEFEVDRMNPSNTISNMRDAVKQELREEMDTQFSDPAQADNLLNNVPVDDRLEYVRRLASSDDNPEALAQNHPEVAAYIKAYDDSLTGWGWTMSEDDPLKENPELLNAYIKERTLGSPETVEASSQVTPTSYTPEGVTDRTSEIDSILPPGSNITVQSSDSRASLVEGIVPDNQIEVMKNDDESVSLDQMKQQDFELQQRAAQLAAEQQTMNQQRMQIPSQSGP